MSALTQYIELFDQYCETLQARSNTAMNALRDDAYKHLTAIGSLPTKKSAGYEKTSLEEMYSPDFGLNINRTRPTIPDAQRLFRCSVPITTPTTAFVVNDMMMRIDSDRLPEGVIFSSISDVAASRPQLIAQYYGKIASLDNPGVALNTLLAQDGTVLYVARGQRLQRPIQIINLHASPLTDLSMRRMLIIVEEDAEANIMVCDHSLNQTIDCASNEVVEISLGRNASLSLCDMEESSAATTRHFMVYSRQEAESTLTLNSITLSAGNTRNEFYATLGSEGANLQLTGMAIARNNEHVDNFTKVNHVAPRCSSNQLFKYILDGKSTGAFEGDITVSPGAVKTAAYQTNRNLLASTDPRMHSQPQLLIYCDDVKCSHGAATGQLDADALFYMRQRGIPEQTARNLLMQAFMADVIDSVPVDALRERLRHMVEKHLHGESTYCADCNLNAPEPEQ